MITPELARKVLAVALRNGGDLAEAYMESQESLLLSLDDGRLEQATQGNDSGAGIRVFYGTTAA